jgi:hypothetical protein
MHFSLKGITKTRDLQEFQIPQGGPGDYWWPKQPIRLQVLWREREELDVTPPGLTPYRFNGQQEIWVREDQDSLFLWRRGLSLLFNLRDGTAQAQLSQDNDWQSILRILYFFAFLKEDGLLLHASALVHRDQVYVFPGESGAGKTTIVRLSPHLPMLTDEITALQMMDDGQVVGHGTPFHGDLGIPGDRLSVPVKGFYYPVQAQENRVVPLTTQESANHLLSCVCAFTTWKERLNRVFDMSFKLAERLPGHLLYFRREPDFWRAIDGS